MFSCTNKVRITKDPITILVSNHSCPFSQDLSDAKSKALGITFDFKFTCLIGIFNGTCAKFFFRLFLSGLSERPPLGV